MDRWRASLGARDVPLCAPRATPCPHPGAAGGRSHHPTGVRSRSWVTPQVGYPAWWPDGRNAPVNAVRKVPHVPQDGRLRPRRHARPVQVPAAPAHGPALAFAPGPRRGLHHLRGADGPVPLPGARPPARRRRRALPSAPDADLRDPLLPPPRRGVAGGLRPRPHPEGACGGDRLPRAPRARARPVGGAPLGRHHRGPRLADHLLRPRAGGTPGGQACVGPDGGEEGRAA